MQAAFDNMPGWIGHIRAGRVRALAVTTEARSDAVPDAPRTAEFLPGYAAFTVAGIAAPAGTPAEVVAMLNAAINAGLADPGLRARLAAPGGMPLPGTPADFGLLIARETEKWARVIGALNLRLE